MLVTPRFETSAALGVLLLVVALAAPPARAESSPETTSRYVSIVPPFVVNLHHGGRNRFLQVAATLKAEDSDSIEVIRQHVGAVRHHVLMTLSGRRASELATLEGKKALQLDVLDALHGFFRDETGSARIDDIYFTEFVVQ